MTLPIGLQLVIDSIRQPEQRKLPERCQVSRSKEVRQRRVYALGGVHVAVGQATPKRLGRHVDELDLLGPTNHCVRNGLSLRHLGDPLNHVVDALEVLEVQRRDDVDPRVEDLLDVLPALLVLDAGSIRVGKLVDQDHVGMASDDRRRVHLLEDLLSVADAPPRDDRETDQLRGGLWATMGLDISDHHVGAATEASSSFVEHGEGLAHPRCCTQVDPQPPPRHDGA